MSTDRRRSLRAVPDRRRSPRIADYREVRWYAGNERRARYGWLVRWSGEGIALLTEKGDTPSLGERIVPGPRPDLRGWRYVAVVRRVEPVSDVLDIVAAERCDDPGPQKPEPGRQLRHDRRGQTRETPERRRSQRWDMNRALRWRVAGGRRIRCSRVLQRSLDGMVILAGQADAPEAGTRIVPCDAAVFGPFGFHSAVIQRAEPTSLDARCLYLEIES